MTITKKLAKVLDEIENMKREIFELKIKVSVKEIEAEKLKEKYERELTKLRKSQSQYCNHTTKKTGDCGNSFIPPFPFFQNNKPFI